MRLRLLACLLLLLIPVRAQPEDAAGPVETSGQTSANNETPEDGTDTTTEEDSVRVAVLGYHDFTQDGEETEMRIRTAKFRSQMERIRELGIPVIPMSRFTAWKRGEEELPERSILITIDDGWKTVYHEAFPILKEFNYPFTVFLYKNYVDGGGRALTTPMIREMIEWGATIGSHSVSHPYPVEFKKQRKISEDAYDRFLRLEMGESKRFLESKFKTTVETYSYPGGYVTEEMLPIAQEFDYHFAFTTRPGMTKRDTPDMTIPRWMILGNYDRIFEFATTFKSADTAPAAGTADSDGTSTPGEPVAPGSPTTTDEPAPKPPTLEHPVFPEPGATINTRMPMVAANLQGVDNLDPESLEMRISGYARVPATFDPENGTFSWRVNRHLRHPSYTVIVTWKDRDGNPPPKPLRWSFQIDQEAAYLLESE